MTIELIVSIISAFGTIVAVGSLIWAVKVYKLTNEDREMSNLKRQILSFPRYCI